MNKFTHLWGDNIRSMLNTLHTDYYDTEHRVRLDHECRIDDFLGVVYTRY